MTRRVGVGEKMRDKVGRMVMTWFGYVGRICEKRLLKEFMSLRWEKKGIGVGLCSRWLDGVNKSV